MKRHRHTKWGTYDPSKKDKDNLKLQVVNFFNQNSIEHTPIENPIIVELYFYMKRPKSHYRSGKFSNIIKDKSPKHHITKPDVDNLAKLVLDAGNDFLWKDDSIIVNLIANKCYGQKPRTEIIIKDA